MIERLFSAASKHEAARLDLDESITHTPADVPGTLLRIRPHDSRSSIADAAAVLRSVHDVRTNVWGTNTSDHHAFECWFHEGTIKFYRHAATETAADTFRRRIGTAYPDSEVTAVETPLAFPAVESRDFVAGAWLSTKRVPAYPIRQLDVEGFGDDPYGNLTAELRSREDSSVVVQVLFQAAKPAWADGDRFKHDGVEAIAAAHSRGTSVGWLNPRTRPPTERERRIAEVVGSQRDEPAFHVTVRLLAISPDRAEAAARVRGVSRVFETTYTGLTGQGFAATPVRSRWRRRLENCLRRHLTRMAERAWVDRGTTVTVDEFAGVAHLPSGDIETPGIDWRYGSDGQPVPADSHRMASPAVRQSGAIDGGEDGV